MVIDDIILYVNVNCVSILLFNLQFVTNNFELYKFNVYKKYSISQLNIFFKNE